MYLIRTNSLPNDSAVLQLTKNEVRHCCAPEETQIPVHRHTLWQSVNFSRTGFSTPVLKDATVSKTSATVSADSLTSGTVAHYEVNLFWREQSTGVTWETPVGLWVKAVLIYIRPSELQCMGCRRLMLLLVQRPLKNVKWAKNQSESKWSEAITSLLSNRCPSYLRNSRYNSLQHCSYILARKTQAQQVHLITKKLTNKLNLLASSSLGLTQIVHKLRNTIRWHENRLLGKKLNTVQPRSRSAHTLQVPELDYR